MQVSEPVPDRDRDRDRDGGGGGPWPGLRPPVRVVVVGAGFAGLAAVRALAGAGMQVTLVDRNVYSTFQPLLYQVATGGINPGDVAYPVRGYARRHDTRFRHGTVKSIDDEARRVLLNDGGVLEYDYLVLALGAAVNYYGVPGAPEHTMALYTRPQSISLRDELMARLERLATGRAGETDLTVVVVGGGATGVEMAGTLAELRTAGLAAAFPEIPPSDIHVVLVEQGPELLAPFHRRLRAYTLRELVARGVDVRLDTAISEVHADRVVLGNGDTLRSDLTIWAAGVAAPAAVEQWGLPQGAGGRIAITPDLRVEGHDRVFAAGDVAVMGEQPLPQLAQPAIQCGAHVGAQIRRLVSGYATQPFRYHDKGSMATIGRRAAVVELPHGIRYTGTSAWLTWLGLHVFTLLGNRNRVSALLNLTWRYLAWPAGTGVIVGDVPE